MIRGKQKIFDITIFTWEEWNEIDAESLCLYNIEFSFESMKKFNGMNCSIDMNGYLEIYDITGNCDVVWSGYVYTIPEFMEELNNKIKKIGVAYE